MFNSKEYWENRYKNGGNSGAGSYGRLAAYKAEFINKFISAQTIKNVAELGCGDGNQLSLFQCDNYIGYDISSTIIMNLRYKFMNDLTKSFIRIDDDYTIPMKSAELCLSLDVIFHLVEDDAFDQYMKRLFSIAQKYVIIYSSNDETMNLMKNPSAIHLKHRCFTKWIHQHYSQCKLIYHEKNKYPFDPNDQDNTSFCDFFIFEIMKTEMKSL